MENEKQDGDVNDLALWMEGKFQELSITSERKRIKYFVQAMNPDLAFQLKEVHKPTSWSAAVQAARDSQMNPTEFGKAGGLKDKPHVPFVNDYQPRGGTADATGEAVAAIHNLTEQMKLLSVNLVNANQLTQHIIGNQRNDDRVNSSHLSPQENHVISGSNTVPIGDRAPCNNSPYIPLTEYRCYACKQ